MGADERRTLAAGFAAPPTTSLVARLDAAATTTLECSTAVSLPLSRPITVAPTTPDATITTPTIFSTVAIVIPPAVPDAVSVVPAAPTPRTTRASTFRLTRS